MVGAALKPHYRAKAISKDQYTEINRTISRMLYDRVGSAESLEGEPRNDLEHAAKIEVQKTIDGLCEEDNEPRQKQEEPVVVPDSDSDVR